VETKDFKKIVDECGQDAKQQELDAAAKELKFEGKTNLTLDEVTAGVQIIWAQQQA
jgi:hypothetical protein